MVDVRERVVCLVSGGIDSPVACALAAKKFDVIPLYFCAHPYTSEEAFTLTINTLGKLKKVTGFKKAIVCSWSKILDAITHRLERKEYTCLICRRCMLQAAELVCKLEGGSGIVTGESLGQKASQTLGNLAAISSGMGIPILRPLLGFDKLEIERLSKKLGLWQVRHAGGCSAAPKHPRTRSDADIVDELLKRLHIDEIIRESVGEAMEIRTFKGDYQSFLTKCKTLG